MLGCAPTPCEARQGHRLRRGRSCLPLSDGLQGGARLIAAQLCPDTARLPRAPLSPLKAASQQRPCPPLFASACLRHATLRLRVTDSAHALSVPPRPSRLLVTRLRRGRRVWRPTGTWRGPRRLSASPTTSTSSKLRFPPPLSSRRPARPRSLLPPPAEYQSRRLGWSRAHASSVPARRRGLPGLRPPWPSRRRSDRLANDGRAGRASAARRCVGRTGRRRWSAASRRRAGRPGGRIS